MTTNRRGSDGEQAELATVVGSVIDETRRLLPLKRMPMKQRALFSTDLTLIGFAIRTGYLVDNVAPQNAVEVFSGLLSRLRALYPIFKSVMHVYETCSDQSFFVHLPLLLEKGFPEILETSSAGCAKNLTTFVCLKKAGPELSTTAPSGLVAVFQSLLATSTRSQIPLSVTLPVDLTPATMVPLAAVLLEYPVAYVPSPDLLQSFLSNIPLDVYEYTLVTDNDQGHLLLKFSCPSALAEAYPDCLGSSHIIAYLTRNFEERLKRSIPRATFRITHSCETKDRLAL